MDVFDHLLHLKISYQTDISNSYYQSVAVVREASLFLPWQMTSTKGEYLQHPREKWLTTLALTA
jgi:hypothetical protein